MLNFETLAFGRFTPGQVLTTFDPAPRPTTPEIESLIEAEWRKQTQLADESGRVLFNGGLLRYVSHQIEAAAGGAAQVFRLSVGQTCYRDFVGTNLYNNHRLEEFGWGRFANPVGTTATLTTRDGRICYGRRSGRVAYHAGHVHTFGGALEEQDHRSDGTIDPFVSLLRELREEVNLTEHDLTDLCCVGLIRDTEIRQPELLFEANVDLTADEIRRRWENAQGADEHDDIVSLPDAPDEIVPFIRSCGPIAPVAIGALLLHGRQAWGESWFSVASAAIAAARGGAGR